MRDEQSSRTEKDSIKKKKKNQPETLQKSVFELLQSENLAAQQTPDKGGKIQLPMKHKNGIRSRMSKGNVGFSMK